MSNKEDRKVNTNMNGNGAGVGAGAGTGVGEDTAAGVASKRRHLEIVLAGFGGQGVLLIGKILAHSGMEAGLEVTWMPAYGPEMRGGTCNCSVVLSDRPIGSPMAKKPHGLIALNLPSLDKFENDVKPGGVIVVNTSLINRLPARDDLLVVPVAANDMAQEAGSIRAANVVSLGAFVGASDVIDPERVRQMLRETFAHKEKLVDVNLRAFDSGLKLGSEIRACACNSASEVCDD